MFTLKKSLLLVFFLGMVSLSLCMPKSYADMEPRDGPLEEENTAGNEKIGEEGDMAVERSVVKRRLCYMVLPCP
uniref:Fejerlectin n=1 Tax=Fejervarya limnocharis TaxID=110108 RepID=A0A8F9RTT4_FEJLI|nr:fejerlectin precursor [Fejervarya limnocharis]